MADIKITYTNGDVTIKFKPDAGVVSKSGKSLIVAQDKRRPLPEGKLLESLLDLGFLFGQNGSLKRV